MTILDPSNDKHARAEQRLRTETIIWLTTVGSDGQPQATPVWFLWDGATFLVYSKRDGMRIRNLATNQRVSLHLEGDGAGGDNVIFEASASIVEDAPPAYEVPEYIEKYRAVIESYGWTPEGFAIDYPHVLRITPTRARVW